jgi:hypothetical protein
VLHVIDVFVGVVGDELLAGDVRGVALHPDVPGADELLLAALHVPVVAVHVHRMVETAVRATPGHRAAI